MYDQEEDLDGAQPAQAYKIDQEKIGALAGLESAKIAIPELQRPFVWKRNQVRDLLDSLYHGYPVGYLITWRNASAPLKDGAPSASHRILIDGQQRVVGLRSALVGTEVLDKHFTPIRIQIAFNPVEQQFGVFNTIIERNPAWINDISTIARHPAKIHFESQRYVENNPDTSYSTIHNRLYRLHNIRYHDIGIIELNEDLPLDTVATVFRLVNQKGVRLSEADFVMSKLAADIHHGGRLLRKAIDYFCHLFEDHTLYHRLPQSDKDFCASAFFPKMSWLGKKANRYLYAPRYGDVLRIAFTSEFKRGKLQDLVAGLSGKNLDTESDDPDAAAQTYSRLESGLFNVINQSNFSTFMSILESAGFIDAGMIGSQNALSFAYILYLRGREEQIHHTPLESLVRRWFVMSLLTNRHAGSVESRIESDIQQITQLGLTQYCSRVIDDQELTASYWSSTLPTVLESAHRNSRYKHILLACQIKLKHNAFLSSDMSVQSLVNNNTLDFHHIFPRGHLKKVGITVNVNSIANLVVTQPGLNRDISNSSPADYFAVLRQQCEGPVDKPYGGISDMDQMIDNLRMNSIPPSMLDSVPNYQQFLANRAKCLSSNIQEYFKGL